MQGKFDEGERLYTEVHTRAVAIGDRWRAMSALNNLGESASVRNDYAMARENFQKALAIAREIGGQKDIGIFLINLADSDIKLGELHLARAGLRAGLALAQRLGALPVEVVAVTCFADLAYAEGETEQALALLGLARNHPAWTGEDQRNLELTLARWALGASVVEAGLAKGAEQDWDATVQELLKT
jgi:tetratricopeptide (TPR) repeat protein